jgi:hypothetical protein
MNTIIQKQLLIDALSLPSELGEVIKSYAFNDKIRSETRKNKNKVIQHLKFCRRRESDNGMVNMRFSYERVVGCSFCLDCGGYSFIADFKNYQNIANNALCSCDDFHEIFIEMMNENNNLQALEFYM